MTPRMRQNKAHRDTGKHFAEVIELRASACSAENEARVVPVKRFKEQPFKHEVLTTSAVGDRFDERWKDQEAPVCEQEVAGGFMSKLERLAETPEIVFSFLRRRGLFESAEALVTAFERSMPNNQIVLRLDSGDGEERLGLYVIVNDSKSSAEQGAIFNSTESMLFIEQDSFIGLPLFAHLEFPPLA